MYSRIPGDIPLALSSQLEPDADMPVGGYYTHPTVPNKLVRWAGDTAATIDELPYAAAHLERLETIYRIPTAHTKFIVSDIGPEKFTARDDVAVVTVSEKIENAVNATEALELAKHSEGIADEFDNLSCKFLKCLGDVAERGGVYMPNLYYYSQCVFDPSRSEGEHLVLVDTETVAVFMEEEPQLRIKGSVPLTLLLVVAEAAKDVIQLQQTTSQVSQAYSQLVETVDKFNPEGHASIELLKQAIVASVERNDESLLDFIKYRYESLEPSDDSMHSFDDVLDSGAPISVLKWQGRL